jgi:amino acid adenylation domain-containing protein
MPTAVHLLREHADTRPSDHAFRFVDEGMTPVSYQELDVAARKVAAALIDAGATGRPVLLLYPPGREYVAGFLGCLYAGALAVPAYPPDPTRLERTLPRLRALTADCGARIALSITGLAEAARSLREQAPELAALRWLATDALPDSLAGSWTQPRLDERTPALLQYTSGSTGTPKGVLLSHANLLHNSGLIHRGFESTRDDIGMSWLPPYHDMGLIGGILQPIYGGFTPALMSPLRFLHRPMAWLEAISQLGVTISGGPNFAFDLCVRKSTPQQRAELDLSRWTVAFCGAEPVRADTLDRFAEAFAPAGFRYDAFYPCYGMAEATLIVTGGRRHVSPTVHLGSPSQRPGAGRQVTCGRALGGQHLVIVDPDTAAECPPGTVGEIWLNGPSVAEGYWHRPEETERTFRARLRSDPDRHYLRTGDLGFLDANRELVVTGRRKDLIIVRGRNIYPQDLEHTVEAGVPWLRPGCGAAFAVERESGERVGVACEIARRDATPPAAEIIAAVRQTVAETHEVGLSLVVLLAPGQVPKTSSGKIQRYACQLRYLAGDFSPDSPGVVACWDETDPGTGSAAGSVDSLDPLTAVVARALEVPVESVRPDTPLTRLGLDSLRAIELRHSLEADLGVRVSLSELLSGADLNTLARHAEHAEGGVEPVHQATRSASPDTPAGPEYELPAGEGQRALWFVQRWAPETTAYQISRAARIDSELDVDRLDRAFRDLVDRHPSLRTSLPDRDGEPVQRVRPWSGPVLARHDATGLDEAGLRNLMQAEASRPFDLGQGPLFRATLFTRGPADHVLLVSLHHVITDFWSLSLMVRELLARYRSGEVNPPTSGGHRVQALDPVVEAARLEYWRRTLRGAPPMLDLPTSFPRPKLQSLRGARRRFRLDPDRLRALDEFAGNAGVTRFVALLAGFAALLARYTRDTEVVIGTPTAGREHHDSRDQLGYFVTPVPLRIPVPPGISFRELARQVRETVLGALDHAVPFPRLVEAVRPLRDPGRPVLTQAMLVLHQPPAGTPDLGGFAVADETARTDLGGLLARPLGLAASDSAFDLSLILAEVAGGLSGVVEYCPDLFDADTVSGLTDHLAGLLAAAVTRPDAPLATVDPLDDATRKQVLAIGDLGAVPYADRTTVHALLSRQATRNPDAVAVVSGSRTMSYSELDRRSDQVAAVLRDRYGVARGSLVAVLLERDDPDLVVSFWGILKAGAAYLPLDPKLPRNRLDWMLRDAAPVALITDTAMSDRLPDRSGTVRCRLDEVDWNRVDPAAAGDAGAGPDDLAYVFYTSGSTGRPKGVMVPHRGVCNLAEAFATRFGIGSADRVLQYASCGFDAWILETVPAQLRGAALHLVPAEAVPPGPLLVELLERQQVTAAILAPAVLAALPETARLPRLTRLVSAADVCPVDLVDRWAPGRHFLNAYGPTEVTVCATTAVCRPSPRRPPIGGPLDNVRLYVLDRSMRPVPEGVPGELYIGGPGITWGYLNRPALTAERFLPDPFGATPGARLYRTGDRVRWLAGGELDFLGRVDQQVKIRGVRIEPGEVEARLMELARPREVAVIARDRPERVEEAVELVAYLVADTHRPAVAELRAGLRAELPEPLVPSAFVYLDRLPRGASGKLDRQALPAPTLADRGVSASVAPGTDLERTVAEVWAAALGHQTVGARDHFFDELGGSSLVVAKVTTELGRRLGREIPVTHLFEHPTVESLARRLRQEAAPDAPVTDPTGQSQGERVAEARRKALARRRNRR